jgi:predicted MPP superfamily phosphohydrolase
MPITRRTFLKGTFATTFGLSAAGAGTLYYAHTIEPNWFDITYQQFALPRLSKAFHGYRMVQISDIHADDTFMVAGRLANLVETINTLKADIVVITGDFVTSYRLDLKATLSHLSDLRTNDGVFGVLGNHDHPSGIEWIRTCLQVGHVQELNNKTHTLHRGDEMLHIVGLDDLWPSNHGTPASIWTHLPLLNQLTTALPENGAAILLVHEPDFADVAAYNKRIDLQLSGHSHGGQVRIPFHGPLILPALSRKYPKGLYSIGNMLLYTNSGLGMLPPQFRFACRPEIAVMDLSGI